MKRGKSIILGILFSLAMILGGGTLALTDITVPGIQAQSTTLTANAGPDQTVPGPSPVEVQFDGSGTTSTTGSAVSYKRFNQWGVLRAEGESPVIEVNFGYKNPKPGAKRTFTLVVADAEGNTDDDQVVITLGKKQSSPPVAPPQPQGDPIIGSTFTGTYYYSDDFNQTIVAGFLNKDRWYLRVTTLNEDIATVNCINFGIYWEDHQLGGYYPVYNKGCVGNRRDIDRDSSITRVMEVRATSSTQWGIRISDSSIATVDFGNSLNFEDSSIVLNEKW
jgi:hypothetical protein